MVEHIGLQQHGTLDARRPTAEITIYKIAKAIYLREFLNTNKK